MQSKTIEGKTYRCEKISVMKQLKILPLMAKLDSEEAVFSSIEELLPLLAKETKLECDLIVVGDTEIDGDLFPHLETHFESMEEMMEVFAWCMGVAIAPKKTPNEKKSRKKKSL